MSELPTAPEDTKPYEELRRAVEELVEDLQTVELRLRRRQQGVDGMRRQVERLRKVCEETL